MVIGLIRSVLQIVYSLHAEVRVFDVLVPWFFLSLTTNPHHPQLGCVSEFPMSLPSPISGSVASLAREGPE